jgi:hypothetical protein
MFTVQSGWLRYAPFATYQLPTIAQTEYFVPFKRSKDETEGRMMRLYRLRWPGEKREPVTIPLEIAMRWTDETGSHKEPAGCDDDGVYLDDLYHNGDIPDEPPPAVAYHLHLNYPKRGVQFPVAGLPGEIVQRIFDSRFVIPEESYMPTIRYLQWLATSHRSHMLFQDFDTVIRDELMGIAIEAARLYFLLLQDCLYDAEAEWYSRAPDKPVWGRLACYLHWVGRIGTGLYASHSGIDLPHVRERLAKLVGTKHPYMNPHPNGATYPDVNARVDQWLREADRESRANSHVDGRAPCAEETKQVGKPWGKGLWAKKLAEVCDRYEGFECLRGARGMWREMTPEETRRFWSDPAAQVGAGMWEEPKEGEKIYITSGCGDERYRESVCFYCSSPQAPGSQSVYIRQENTQLVLVLTQEECLQEKGEWVYGRLTDPTDADMPNGDYIWDVMLSAGCFDEGRWKIFDSGIVEPVPVHTHDMGIYCRWRSAHESNSPAKRSSFWVFPEEVKGFAEHPSDPGLPTEPHGLAAYKTARTYNNDHKRRKDLRVCFFVPKVAEKPPKYGPKKIFVRYGDTHTTLTEEDCCLGEDHVATILTDPAGHNGRTARFPSGVVRAVVKLLRDNKCFDPDAEDWSVFIPF